MNKAYAPVRIVVVPDTQAMAKKWPGLLAGMSDWIANHAAELDGVLHVGDVVNDGDSDMAQLLRGQAWTARVAGSGLPTFIASGNHDDDNRLAGPSRSLVAFDRYLLPSALNERPWWGGSYGESVSNRAGNYYGWIGQGDRRLLVVVLEFGPRDAVVQWARAILAQNQSCDAIVCTHAFLDGDGDYTRTGSPFDTAHYPASRDGHDGESLWAALRHSSNLRVIVSGHQIPPCLSYRVDAAADGHPVLATYQNWQHEPNGGNGRVRLLEWNPRDRTVDLSVINTATDTTEHDAGSDVHVSLAPGSADLGLCWPGADNPRKVVTER